MLASWLLALGLQAVAAAPDTPGAGGATAAAAPAAAAVATGAAAESVIVTVLATTDMHGHVYGAWTTVDGLPHNSIRAIVQTRDGYLWLATHAGLARFDGVRFQVYDTRNSGLRHNEVRALAEDGDGTLWVGTTGGLALYRDGWRETGLPALRERIQALCEDERGRLFAGTPRELLVLHRGSIERVPLRSEDG